MTPLSLDALRELAPGFVMGTLTPAEQADFARALTDPSIAAELQPEIDAHRAAMEFIATSITVQPSPDLRSRVLARIASEPQLSGAATKTLPFQRPARPVAAWVTGGLATALAASALFSVSLQREVVSLRASVLARDSAMAKAQARLSARDETVRILTEGGNDLVLVRLVANENAGPAMQLFWNVKDGSAVIHASGLRPVAATRAYALWMIRDGKPVPLALFKPDADGHRLINSISVPKDMAGVAAFAVTEEPAEGSPQPTMTPFLVGAVGPR